MTTSFQLPISTPAQTKKPLLRMSRKRGCHSPSKNLLHHRSAESCRNRRFRYLSQAPHASVSLIPDASQAVKKLAIDRRDRRSHETPEDLWFIGWGSVARP